MLAPNGNEYVFRTIRKKKEETGKANLSSDSTC